MKSYTASRIVAAALSAALSFSAAAADDKPAAQQLRIEPIIWRDLDVPDFTFRGSEIDADRLGPGFIPTSEFWEQFAHHYSTFTKEQKAELVAYAANIIRARPDLITVLPDGSTARINADLLGPAPDYKLTPLFILQLDPHRAIDSETLATLTEEQAQGRLMIWERHRRSLERIKDDPAAQVKLLNDLLKYMETDHKVTAAMMEQIRQAAIKVLKDREAQVQPQPEPQPSP